jgi:hypothetical protein
VGSTRAVALLTTILTTTRTNVDGHQRTDNSRMGLIYAGFRTFANDYEPKSSNCGSRGGRGFESRRSPQKRELSGTSRETSKDKPRFPARTLRMQPTVPR